MPQGGEGLCTRVSREGERCGLFPELAVCASGLDCGVDDLCAAPSNAPLAVGAVCSESFTLVGECEDGWCDVTGTDLCQPFHALGAECQFPYECETGVCAEGVCAEQTFCR